MDRRTRLVGPLSSFGGEGRGEEALIPAIHRTGSRNGPRKLDNSRSAVTILKASSPQPSPPKEERERHASCVVSIKLNGSAGRPPTSDPASYLAGWEVCAASNSASFLACCSHSGCSWARRCCTLNNSRLIPGAQPACS